MNEENEECRGVFVVFLCLLLFYALRIERESEMSAPVCGSMWKRDVSAIKVYCKYNAGLIKERNGRLCLVLFMCVFTVLSGFTLEVILKFNFFCIFFL